MKVLAIAWKVNSIRKFWLQKFMVECVIHFYLTILWLYRIQEEREERHKYKGVVKSVYEVEDPVAKAGSFDNGDPTTTNLYLGNLNPKVKYTARFIP